MPKRYRSRSRRSFRRRVRPRRFKRYRRVYRRRGGYRRRYRGYSRQIRIPTQFQNNVFKRFKWVDNANTRLQVGTGEYLAYKDYAINTLFQPDGTNILQVPGLNELCSLYNYCKVYSGKISVRFTAGSVAESETPNPPMLCYLATVPYGQALPSGVTVTQWQQARDYVIGNPRYCINKLLNAPYNDRTLMKLSKYVKVGTMVGNNLEFKASMDWDQPIVAAGPYANPANLQLVRVGTMIQDANPQPNSFQVNMTVSIVHYVRFWGFKYELN